MTQLVDFFFNDTATTEIYTLSLHDALPIYVTARKTWERFSPSHRKEYVEWLTGAKREATREQRLETTLTRSEEHTSELQSRQYLVCRLLLEKKNRRLHHRIPSRADTSPSDF